MSGTSALTVILLHGGGFLFGSAGQMDGFRPALPRAARAVSVEYTLGNYRLGLEDVRRVARAERRRGRRVLALGVSAGGGFATALAARREVDAAVVVCPVIDYPTWADAASWRMVRVDTMADRRALAPNRLYTRRSAPVRIVQSAHDRVVDPRPNRRFAARWPQVRMRTVAGAHHCPPVRQVARTIAAAVRSDVPGM